ncbi:MAG: LPD38 domain-containing protein, partial [Bacteroidota bacterium]
LVVMGFDGKVAFRIPLAFGWSVFSALGNNAYDYSMGRINAEQASRRMGNAFADAFNPFRGSQAFDDWTSVILALTPTPIEAPIQLGFNRSFWGPIQPEWQYNNRGELEKRWQVQRPDVNPTYDYVARMLDRKGIIDVSPHVFEFLIDWSAGTAGRDMLGFVDAFDTDQARRTGVTLYERSDGTEVKFHPDELPVIKRMVNFIDEDKLAYSMIWQTMNDTSSNDMSVISSEFMEVLQDMQGRYRQLQENGGFEEFRFKQMDNAINYFISRTYKKEVQQETIQMFRERGMDGSEDHERRMRFYQAENLRSQRDGVPFLRWEEGGIRRMMSKRMKYDDGMIERIENTFGSRVEN